MIGTITLHHNANYGANLQAYALVKCLSTLTDEPVCLINYQNERIRNLYRVAPYDVLDDGIRIRLSSCKRFAKMILNPKGTVIRDRKFYSFRKKYIPLTRIVTTPKEIESLNCSCVFIGSDQIWNDLITGDQKHRVFYGNVKNENNIVAAYAPSLGNSIFSECEDLAVTKHINKFDHLSVREAELIQLINNRYMGDIQVVCDPVFLLKNSDWEELSTNKYEKSRYVFVYLLERNPIIVEIVKKIASKFNLDIIAMSDGGKLSFDFGNYEKTAGPNEFISAVKNAAYVVTNSFHGTVFSMIFHKKFITIPDTRRGVRMKELLKQYSLEDRLCCRAEDFSVDQIEQEIDYPSVERQLEINRQKSIGYLRKVLSHSKENRC